MSETETDNAGVRIPPPAVLLFVAALCVASERWLAIPTLSLPQPTFFLLGLAVVALALLISFGGFWQFLRTKVNPIPVKPAARLVTGGIYRFTRNPMYLGMVLIPVGVALTYGSLAFLAGAVAIFLFFNTYAIPREEAYMTRRFGRDYTDFCGRVRRWI